MVTFTTRQQNMLPKVVAAPLQFARFFLSYFQVDPTTYAWYIFKYNGHNTSSDSLFVMHAITAVLIVLEFCGFHRVP